jgi:hypothetical protein
VVASSSFGQLFATQLNGQIYAQPILADGVLLVATENDWVYGLNSVTGKIEWSRQIGKPWPDASLHCADLTPNLGITSTPAVNPATGIAYMVDQAVGAGGGIGWFMNAIDVATGAEVPNFPVLIKGPAENDPQQPFVNREQLQRPGLLLLNGVVYAAFGSHCSFQPYVGFVAGVSTSGRLTTMWTDEGPGGQGGGIWQGGGGVSSDGPNQILVATGNGFAPTTSPVGKIPASSPPANLAESVVRLVVQPDGSLKPTAFFAMDNDAQDDAQDLDLTGSPVVLPGEFSTPQYPHLLVATGKQGIVYLLNRDNLGGHDEGPGGTNLVVGQNGPNGRTISTAGVWPGNGGYVYVSTLQGVKQGAPGAIDVYKFIKRAGGRPGLQFVAASSQAMLFGVSGPLVTSDGTAPGSAVVWVLNAANLDAFAAVPDNGKLTLLGTWFVGNSDAFNPPGIGVNMVYAGMQTGMVYGFGTISAS